jgi:putative Mn2+ efflux pump MntP
LHLGDEWARVCGSTLVAFAMALDAAAAAVEPLLGSGTARMVKRKKKKKRIFFFFFFFFLYLNGLFFTRLALTLSCCVSLPPATSRTA